MLSASPASRVRSWHVWLLVWRTHRWIAFGFGALLVLMSATGSLLVVHHELEALLEADRHRVAPTASPDQPLADIVRGAAAEAPADYRPFRLMPAAEPGATHKLLLLGPDQKTRWAVFADPASGRILWSGPDQSLFTPWLLHLHMHLQLGRAGYYLTGLAGVALTLLALTGLYIHRDRLATLWRHPLRLALGWRVALADLHSWIGIVTLYFPLMLGVTGTLYALVSLDQPAAKPAAVTFSAAQLPALEPLRDAARQRFPGAEVLRLQFPAEAQGAITVLLLHRTNPPWQKFSRVEFTAATGELRRVRAADEASAGEQFRAMLAPLHFGFYGATWVKWAYFFGGLAPLALAVSGTALWWVRTRGARIR